MRLFSVSIGILLFASSMPAMAGELYGKGLVCELEGVGLNQETRSMESTKQTLYLIFYEESDNVQWYVSVQETYPSKAAPKMLEGRLPYEANDREIVINPMDRHHMTINRATIEISTTLVTSPLPNGINGSGKCQPKSREEVEKIATEEEVRLTKAWEAEQKKTKDAVAF